jgi:NodT family efflux transporter outer membrane factor (OMF) lipoprotein
MKRAALIALLLTGCTTVGPNYQQPQTQLPDRYLEAASAEQGDLSNWWQGFNDPQLTALVDQALRQNLDLELAAARIREARAQEGVAGAGSSPQLAAEASVTRQRISENAIPVPPGSGSGGGGSIGLPGSEFTSWRAGFDASWELDLFGRNRREREAAAARTGAAVWSRHDVEVTVAAEVASAYLRLRTLQGRAVNAEAELARLTRYEQLIRAQVKGGLVTGQILEQQRSDRSAAAAAIPALQAEAKAEIHALGVLIGQSPEALADQLAAPVGLAPTPPPVPPGLPSDLLRRRPDIRAAERELAAATADIGVATADLYPRISLTAGPALVSTALGSLLEWGSRSFSAGAALDWPIFDGGRRRANIEVHNARQEQATITYRKTILVALQDVEDALSNADGNRRKLAELEEAHGNAVRAEKIANTRYRGGLVTFADVLEAQERRLLLEAQVVETKGAVARDTVALVKALGGGWQESEK